MAEWQNYTHTSTLEQRKMKKSKKKAQNFTHIPSLVSGWRAGLFCALT